MKHVAKISLFLERKVIGEPRTIVFHKMVLKIKLLR